MRNLFVIILLPLLLNLSPNNLPGQGVILLKFNGFTTPDNFYLMPSYLQDTSKTWIQKKVGENFRNFSVIITQDDSIFYATPVNLRIKAVITSTLLTVRGEMAAGVGPINGLARKDSTPCYISTFSGMYLDKDIANVITHEVGHILGLYHQSREKNGEFTEYSPGNDDEAPIMGFHYYAKDAIWIKGLNSQCEYQDDEAIIGQTFRRLNDYELSLLKE